MGRLSSGTVHSAFLGASRVLGAGSSVPPASWVVGFGNKCSAWLLISSFLSLVGMMPLCGLLCCSAWPMFLALLGSGLSPGCCSAWPVLSVGLLCGLAWHTSMLGCCSAWLLHRGDVPSGCDVISWAQTFLSWTDTHLSTAPIIVGDCTDLWRTALCLDWSSGSSARSPWSSGWTS